MIALRSPDVVTRRVPLGMAFRDACDLSLVRDDLAVTLTAKLVPGRKFMLRPTPSGTWMAHVVPGVGPLLAADPASWAAQARPFTVDVSDPRGRYLPLRFDAAVPARTIFAWPGWLGLAAAPTAPLRPVTAPPGFVPDYLPLFPSVAAAIAGSRAEVRAHLAIAVPGQPDRNAAWAAMTVSIGGSVCGLGLADASGAIVVSFAYPLLPTPTAAERAAGTSHFEWPVTLAVHFNGLAGDPPDLAAILAQLASPPATLLGSTVAAPPVALGIQTLVVGRPLILRTTTPPPDSGSSLYLTPA